MGSITYIIGTRNAGKTSLIEEVARLMTDAVGVMAIKCYDSDGYITGYDALLWPARNRLPLCRRANDDNFTLRHGGFWFDSCVFENVQKYILDNLHHDTPVFIDEIGTLEIKHHMGYYPLLAALMQYDDLNLILTIRG